MLLHVLSSFSNHEYCCNVFSILKHCLHVNVCNYIPLKQCTILDYELVFPFGFKSVIWSLISPVPVHCFDLMRNAFL